MNECDDCGRASHVVDPLDDTRRTHIPRRRHGRRGHRASGPDAPHARFRPSKQHGSVRSRPCDLTARQNGPVSRACPLKRASSHVGAGPRRSAALEDEPTKTAIAAKQSDTSLVAHDTTRRRRGLLGRGSAERGSHHRLRGSGRRSLRRWLVPADWQAALREFAGPREARQRDAARLGGREFVAVWGPDDEQIAVRPAQIPLRDAGSESFIVWAT